MLLNTTLPALQVLFNRAGMPEKCPAKLPSWSILNKGKVRKESLKEAHVEFAPLDLEKAWSGKPFIECSSGKFARQANATGKVFIRIYDNVAIPEDASILSIPCKFSFQQHVYGDFVVIRNNLTHSIYSQAELEITKIGGWNTEVMELYGHRFAYRSGRLL